MKVSINYTVDLEEVPATTAEMIVKKEEMLKNQVLTNLVSAIDSLDSSDPAACAVAVNEIDKARRNMEKVDTTLQDCQNILQGYITAIASQKAQAFAEQASAAAPETPDLEQSNEEGEDES